jgi:Fe-S-cluster containining protein
VSASSGSPGNRDVLLDPTTFYVCQRCTACCKWPGDVRLEDDEIAPIAAHLGLGEQEFLDRYVRLRTNRQGLSLIEKDNHECIMLDGDSCRIHAVKPEQCRGFPNKWNFPGWQNVCDAKGIPMAEARAKGWAK